MLRVALRQGTFLAHARSMKRYLQFQAVLAFARGSPGSRASSPAMLRLVLVPLVGALAGRPRSCAEPQRHEALPADRRLGRLDACP